MTNHEFALLWRQLTILQDMVAEVVTLQRAALSLIQSTGVGASGPGNVFLPLDSILVQLDDMSERLRRHQQETVETVGRLNAGAKLRLGEIDIERINVIEPNGTTRMVISNAESAPDPMMDGHVVGQRKGGNDAGITFYNSEGDECGGLTYKGKQVGDRYEAGAGLLFDQFGQDQVLFLEYTDHNGQCRVGLNVLDRPDFPLAEWAERIQSFEQKRRELEGAEFEALVEEAWAAGLFGASRLFVGRDEHKTATVALKDARGRARIRLAVEADGTARLEFLDEQGTVVVSLPNPPGVDVAGLRSSAG